MEEVNVGVAVCREFFGTSLWIFWGQVGLIHFTPQKVSEKHKRANESSASLREGLLILSPKL